MKDQIKKLDIGTFNLIVQHTPLVSIDLIVENQQQEIMLGLRKNRPARDFWFVPGGRILKNESLRDAFERITSGELGMVFTLEQSVFTGVYEHFHNDDNFSGQSGYGTHYIVLAFKIQAPGSLIIIQAPD